MAETLLTVKHLVKQYGDHIVLNDISLDIKKGEVIVVVVPSGCDKSQLLDLSKNHNFKEIQTFIQIC